MKKKIVGILYICTGPYKLFWDNFYNSFEKYFLTDCEKRYFVFTDNKDYIKGKKNVYKYKIDAMPWPLNTLLRFKYFLSIKDEYKNCDCLMYLNANVVCNKEVQFNNLFINENNKIFVTLHPGYYKDHKSNFPYERNKKSYAYVPYNKGNKYVIGAFFGAMTEQFIKMSETIEENIEKDLKNNVIAKWHDESHLNRFIIDYDGVNYLPPSYMYPVGFNINEESIISGVSKKDKFNVYNFKNDCSSNICNRKFRNIINNRIINKFKYCLDLVLNVKCNQYIK